MEKEQKLVIKKDNYQIIISIKKENENETLFFFLDQEKSYNELSKTFSLAELKKLGNPFDKVVDIKKAFEMISTVKSRISYTPPKNGEKPYILLALPRNQKKIQLDQKVKENSIDVVIAELEDLKKQLKSRDEEIDQLKKEVSVIKDTLEKQNRVDYKVEFLDIPKNVDVTDGIMKIQMKVKNVSNFAITDKADTIYLHVIIGGNDNGEKRSIPLSELCGLKPEEEKTIIKELEIFEEPEEKILSVEIGHKYYGDKEDIINNNNFESTLNIIKN